MRRLSELPAFAQAALATRPDGVRMLATAVTGHLLWITSRAAGIAALLLSSVSVAVGLAMGGRLVKRRGADLRVTHEALSLATLAAILVHAVSLLGDSYLRLGVADITIPFASGYREPWMAMGVLAGWMLALLGLSYYARARIGVQRWRTLHRFTALAWVLGIAHSLGEGTDAGQRWFLVCAGIVVVPALALLIARLSGGRVPSRPRSKETAHAA
jgi:sulfoxide reductase heme-binding subunit YedZ